MDGLKAIFNKHGGAAYKDLLIIVGSALLLAIILSAPTILSFAVDSYEDLSFKVAPSAAKAFYFGERHFNGQDWVNYDIDRAQYFFTEAEKKDSSLPYVHHELARIYFLRGDLSTALKQISVQI